MLLAVKEAPTRTQARAASRAPRVVVAFMGATLGILVVRFKVHFHEGIGDQSGLGTASARRFRTGTRAWPYVAGGTARGGALRAAAVRHPVAVEPGPRRGP